MCNVMVYSIVWCSYVHTTFYRKFRQRDISKFHIQLCISLFCMLIVFVSGIDETSVYEGCVAVSVLIHYFTLVIWMWMGALAVYMYQKLVVVFVHTTTRYIITVSIVCWCKFPDIELVQVVYQIYVPSFHCSGTNCSSSHPIGH